MWPRFWVGPTYKGERREMGRWDWGERRKGGPGSRIAEVAEWVGIGGEGEVASCEWWVD